MPNVLVVGSQANGLAYSLDDGATWHASNVTTGYYAGLHYDGLRWIAVGDHIRTSVDGQVWSAGLAAVPQLCSVTHHNGVWVVGGVSLGRLYYTTNPALTSGWTTLITTGGGTTRCDYGGGMFVAASRSRLLTSTNGTTWINGAAPSPSTYEWARWHNDFGLWLISGSGFSSLRSSPDAVTWTALDARNITWRGSMSRPGRLSVIGRNTSPAGPVYATTTGAWSGGNMTPNRQWLDGCLVGSTFHVVGVGGTDFYGTTTDGITITPRSIITGGWVCIAYGPSHPPVTHTHSMVLSAGLGSGGGGGGHSMVL